MNIFKRNFMLTNSNVSNFWIHVQSYGNFDHRDGIKCVNTFTAYQVLVNFHSFIYRILRGFKSLPVYASSNSIDPEAADSLNLCGHVSDMEVRKDGIWVKVSLNAIGLRMYHAFNYRSVIPSWRIVSIGNNTYEPQRLLSLKLMPLEKSKINIASAKAAGAKVPVSNGILAARNRDSNNNYFLSLVNQRMTESDEDYTTAWRHVKRLRKDLFDEFSL